MFGFAFRAFAGNSPELGTSALFWEFGVPESVHGTSGASQCFAGNWRGGQVSSSKSFDRKQAISWWESAWDPALVLWFPSLEGHPGTKKIQVRSLSFLEKQRLFVGADFLCSSPWLVTQKGVRLVSVKDHRKWQLLFYPRPVLEKLTEPASSVAYSLSELTQQSRKTL